MLSDSENARLEKAFNKIARWVHKEKKTAVTPDDLGNKTVQGLADEINDILQRAIQTGIDFEIPAATMQHFKNNVYVFSGCKTYAELRELSDMLIDDEGAIKQFSKFFKDVRSVHDTYNKSYLQSEYQFATQSANMAGKWADFEQYGDRYYLQYRTANDDRVRYSHQLMHNITLPPSDVFWSEFFPPNGWRCRCNAVQVRKSKYEPSDSNEARRLGNEATYTVGAGGKNTSAMFRFNAGKEKIIFPVTHPYYNDKEVVKQVEKGLSNE
ncbi:phage minor head protein [Dysgonomonas sp. UBA7698]|uniref:phage head morphogenesis protein n=1 Tax=Dysgonomonas sp. UBA7698 TaxID=1946427 RepID=UPI0025BEB1C1|nr:phage minor head protein [Dysgonomonas sp. UBA7698]